MEETSKNNENAQLGIGAVMPRFVSQSRYGVGNAELMRLAKMTAQEQAQKSGAIGECAKVFGVTRKCVSVLCLF